MDHLSDPVVFRLVLLLCQFAAFAYYVIDGFISVTAESTFAILVRLIYPSFDMIGSYGADLYAIRRDSVSLLKFPFLSHIQVLSCEMLFISR